MAKQPAQLSPVISREERALRALSDEVLVAMVSGADDWHTEAAPDLGLDAVMMADGPHGLRKVNSTSLADLQASETGHLFPHRQRPGRHLGTRSWWRRWGGRLDARRWQKASEWCSARRST
jgi:hypothetical protein